MRSTLREEANTPRQHDDYLPYTHNNIRQGYGLETSNKYKTLANLNQKLAGRESQITFLIKCRDAGIFPRFIHDKATVFQSLYTQTDTKTHLINKMEQTFMDKYLRMQINLCHDQIRDLRNEIAILDTDLSSCLSDHDYIACSQNIAREYFTTLNRRKNSHINKFNKIQIKTPAINLPTNFCVNLSSTQIPADIQQFLGLGPKYCLTIPKHKLPYIDILADIDEILGIHPDSDKITHTRLLITADMINYLKTDHKQNNTNKYINFLHNKTRRFIQSHPEIMIVNSDKTNQTIIINKSEYEEKAQQHLSDPTIYERLEVSDVDYNDIMKNNNNRFIRKLIMNGELTMEAGKQLINETPTPPRIYFTIKNHKEGNPVRPIVSTVNSASANLKQMLLRSLKPLANKHSYDVKNSNELKELLANMALPPHHKLISLDVKSLYTNVNQDEAIQIVMDRFDEIDTTLSMSAFREALILCIKTNNLFLSGNTYYRQKDGLAMGCPLSCLLAGIVLDKLIHDIENKIHFKIFRIFKYVDDLLLIIHEDQINYIINTFNSQHQTLKFTLEIEENSSIAFLDLRLHRKSEHIIIDWYAKPTASGRLINYTSMHPTAMKHNIGLSLAKRIIGLSDPRFHRKNYKIISRLLQQNNYPNKTIRKIIFKTKKFYNTTPSTITPNNEPKQYKSMPYVPIITDQIEKRIRDISDDTIVAKKPLNQLRNLFTQTKTKVPNHNTGVIYQVECSDNNCNQKYIGETGRSMHVRMKEHIRDRERATNKFNDFKQKIKNELNLHDQRITRSQANDHNRRLTEYNIRCDEYIRGQHGTAAVQHQLQTGHIMNFDSATVLHRTNHLRKRRAVEAMYIHLNKHTAVNYKTDTIALNIHTKAALNSCTRLCKRSNSVTQ